MAASSAHWVNDVKIRGLWVPVADVGPFLEKDPVESLNSLVGLGTPESSLLDGDAGAGAGSIPQPEPGGVAAFSSPRIAD
jgi:hypothetical protein